MAKKKKSQKKKFRNQAQATPKKTAVATQQGGADVQSLKKDSDKPAVTSKKSTPELSGEFAYVKGEVKHALFIVAGIIVVYIVLWYVFTYTSVGPATTKLFKI